MIFFDQNYLEGRRKNRVIFSATNMKMAAGVVCALGGAVNTCTFFLLIFIFCLKLFFSSILSAILHSFTFAVSPLQAYLYTSVVDAAPVYKTPDFEVPHGNRFPVVDHQRTDIPKIETHGRVMELVNGEHFDDILVRDSGILTSRTTGFKLVVGCLIAKITYALHACARMYSDRYTR